MMRKIAVVGLGYVGLALAVGLSKQNLVYGVDISQKRVKQLKDNIDSNQLLTPQELSQANVNYVSNIDDAKEADFFIVSVSTPAFYYELPNLDPLVNATKQLASVLKKGDIVVYESTVYPGTTEEVCVPLLEEISQLKCGQDFHVGYSPERINPGDAQNSLKTIPKVVSAQNGATLNIIKEVYQICCDTVYAVSNIMTGEAVKILENTQRDINIALMNEFSEIMHAMDLNVHEIIEAAKTKWSFVPFKPGFVGGHCISIDSLYLAFKAKRIGVQHDLILAARKINDGITKFVRNELVNILIKNNINVNQCSLGIFGVTYKENIPDIRNSLALKFIKELKVAGFNCQIHDPFADQQLMLDKYDIQIQDFESINNISVAIVIVAHDFYREVGIDKFIAKMGDKKIIMDIPNVFIDEHNKSHLTKYWSL